MSYSSPIPDKARNYEIYLMPALALLTLAIFSPVLWHDFVDYDDLTFVVRNSHVQSGFSLGNILWAFTSVYEAKWIPLTWISHMLDAQLFGMHASGHHFINILFHIGMRSNARFKQTRVVPRPTLVLVWCTLPRDRGTLLGLNMNVYCPSGRRARKS